MKQRVISAIVALIIVIPIIILGGTVFYIGASLLALIGLYELLRVKDKIKKIPLTIKVLSVISYLLLLYNNLNKLAFLTNYEVYLLILLLLITPIVFYNKSKKYDIEDALFVIASILFLGIGFTSIINIRMFDLKYLIFIMSITIFTDTFAYIVGRLIGKNKFAPTVSPNKTWEGFIGGLVFGTFISTVYYISVFNYSGNYLKIIFIIAILSTIGQIGDLVFSSIKRHYKIKDFGNIMPGHGGVLDRLDSIIFVSMAFNILFNIM